MLLLVRLPWRRPTNHGSESSSRSCQNNSPVIPWILRLPQAFSVPQISSDPSILVGDRDH